MLDHKTVSRMDIRDIVRDPEWQALRQALVGTWKKTPEQNAAILEAYLQDFSCPLRLRRVHNYLTGSAFRMGIISHPAITHLLRKVREHRNTE